MNNYVAYCFNLRAQAHLYHFQTRSYAEHKALEEFYTLLLELLDNLTETYQGKYWRISLEWNKHSLSDYTSNTDVSTTIKWFVQETKALKEETSESDSDLQNILDEMIWLGNRTLFLLSLK